MKAVGARVAQVRRARRTSRAVHVYVDDVRVPGTLWTKVLRSPVPPRRPQEARHEEGRAAPGCPCSGHARGRAEERPRPPRGARRPGGRAAARVRDDVRWKGQAIALVAAEDEATAPEAVERSSSRSTRTSRCSTSGRPSTRTLPGSTPGATGTRSSAGRTTPPGPAADPEGEHRGGLRDGGRRRPGRLPPAGDRAAAGRDPGRAHRARAGRAPDDLLEHAGDVLLDGRRRRPSPAAAEPLKFVGGTVGGGFGGKVDTATRRRPRCSRSTSGRPVKMALDARGGVPLLVDPRALAHRDRRRADERRLDPRPEDGDAPRLGRLRALLAVRPDEALLPRRRRLHDPEHPLRRLRRVHEPPADQRDARLRRDIGLLRGRDAHEPDRHYRLGIDPYELRLRNANRIADTTPNSVVLKDPSTVPVLQAIAGSPESSSQRSTGR